MSNTIDDILSPKINVRINYELRPQDYALHRIKIVRETFTNITTVNPPNFVQFLKEHALSPYDLQCVSYDALRNVFKHYDANYTLYEDRVVFYIFYPLTGGYVWCRRDIPERFYETLKKDIEDSAKEVVNILKINDE